MRSFAVPCFLLALCAASAEQKGFLRSVGEDAEALDVKAKTFYPAASYIGHWKGWCWIPKNGKWGPGYYRLYIYPAENKGPIKGMVYKDGKHGPGYYRKCLPSNGKDRKGGLPGPSTDPKDDPVKPPAVKPTGGTGDETDSEPKDDPVKPTGGTGDEGGSDDETDSEPKDDPVKPPEKPPVNVPTRPQHPPVQADRYIMTGAQPRTVTPPRIKHYPTPDYSNVQSRYRSHGYSGTGIDGYSQDRPGGTLHTIPAKKHPPVQADRYLMTGAQPRTVTPPRIKHYPTPDYSNVQSRYSTQPAKKHPPVQADRYIMTGAQPRTVKAPRIKHYPTPDYSNVQSRYRSHGYSGTGIQGYSQSRPGGTLHTIRN